MGGESLAIDDGAERGFLGEKMANESEQKREIFGVFYLWLRGRKPSGLDYLKILHGHSWVHMMNSIIKRNTPICMAWGNR
jgi:hypothetical protein